MLTIKQPVAVDAKKSPIVENLYYHFAVIYQTRKVKVVCDRMRIFVSAKYAGGELHNFYLFFCCRHR